MSTVTFTCNEKGGSGKTTCAVGFAEVWRSQIGRPLRLIDCDDRHKLARFKGDQVLKIESSISADLLAENPDLALSYWDPIGQLMVSGADCLIDLAAGVGIQVLQWADRSQIFEYLSDTTVIFIVPTKPDPEGLTGARQILESVPDIIPTAIRVLVLNGLTRDFAKYSDNEDYGALLSLPGVMIIKIPYCSSPLWVTLEKDGISYATAVELGAEKIARACGYTAPWVAARDLGSIAKWGKDVHEAFQPLFSLIPR
ncbi:MAG: hypothetical protein WCJ64_03530 [Rhodospirillaceae bacterium]